MSAGSKNSSNIIQMNVPAKASYLSSIRQLSLDVVSNTDLSREDRQDFSLAVVEAATNAIRHSRSKSLKITFAIDSTGITAKIIDKGCGFKFSPRRCDFPSPEQQGGRGIPLMSNLVDFFKVESEPGHGTEVTLVKEFRQEQRDLSAGKRSQTGASCPAV